jgi:hypothetical protein
MHITAEWLTAWATVGAAAAGIGSAVAGFCYLKSNKDLIEESKRTRELQWKVFQMQNEAHVFCYLFRHAGMIEYASIAVKNLGSGVGRNVRFEIKDPNEALEKSRGVEGWPLLNGLSYLAPGVRCVFGWAIPGTRDFPYMTDKGSVFRIIVHYDDAVRTDVTEEYELSYDRSVAVIEQAPAH